MAEITFGGLATGLATDDIVTKLMAVQRRPIDRLEKSKEYETTRLQAYNQLNTRLEDLRQAVDAMNLTSEVRTTKVNLNSTSAFTATSNGALSGSYNIAVKQLAQVQKEVSAEGYASTSASLFDTGTLQINGTAIAVDSTNNSLSGLMAAINAVSDVSGVSASIINDGTGSDTAYHLILTGKDAETGIDLTGTDIPFSTITKQSHQQARLTIDGIDVVSNSNIITGVISGVTLNLSATSPVDDSSQPTVYTATKMDIVADTGPLKEKISAFVSSYNKVMEWIKEGYQTKTTTDTTTTTDGTEEDILSDYLRGDATVNSIKRGLQSILTDPTAIGSLKILSEVGITTNKDGTLNLNSGKLDNAIDENFEGVVTLLVGKDTVDGVMKKFNSYLLDITSATDGMYANKRSRYTASVKNLDDQIAQKETLMAKIEESMRAQFNAMELLISNLNSQGDYLTQQFEAISNIGKNS